MSNVKRMTQAQFVTEAVRRFGVNSNHWAVVCPVCGAVQTLAQLMHAGLAKSEAQATIGISCIGRFNGRSNKTGCDYTLLGLIKCHKLEVEMEPVDGKSEIRACFELATVDG